MDYKSMIGDGKLPNKYWVFQYDEKFRRKTGDDGFTFTEPIKEDHETPGDGLIGEYNTYQEALQAIDAKAYLPHVVIEDRLSGQVFEQICIVCSECGHEEYDTIHDTHYTEEEMKRRGVEFA